MKTIIAKSVTGKETQVNVSDLVLAISQYAVIINGGRVLISPQWKENGYDFPGGHLNLGEDNLDGLVREVKEETGFVVRPLNVLGVYTSFFMHPRKNKAQQSINIYYSAEIVSGEISTDGLDTDELGYAKEARFVTLAELKSMELMHTSQEPLKVIIPYLEERLRR